MCWSWPVVVSSLSLFSNPPSQGGMKGNLLREHETGTKKGEMIESWCLERMKRGKGSSISCWTNQVPFAKKSGEKAPMEYEAIVFDCWQSSSFFFLKKATESLARLCQERWIVCANSFWEKITVNRLVSSCWKVRGEKGFFARKSPSTFAWSTPYTNAFASVVNQRMGGLRITVSFALHADTVDEGENRKTGKIRVVPKENAGM